VHRHRHMSYGALLMRHCPLRGIEDSEMPCVSEVDGKEEGIDDNIIRAEGGCRTPVVECSPAKLGGERRACGEGSKGQGGGDDMYEDPEEDPEAMYDDDLERGDGDSGPLGTPRCASTPIVTPLMSPVDMPTPTQDCDPVLEEAHLEARLGIVSPNPVPKCKAELVMTLDGSSSGSGDTDGNKAISHTE